jgi:hypothetical protein
MEIQAELTALAWRAWDNRESTPTSVSESEV